MRPIDQQTILITGATSGLGRELAGSLAKQGASLLLHGRDLMLGLETMEEIREATGNQGGQFLRANLSSLRERLAGSGVTVNALHPASLMPTKMVLEAGWQTMSSVEEGLQATLRLVTDPSLENVTGEYFDGLRLAKANPQAYDKTVRQRLAAVSQKLASSFQNSLRISRQ
jgi:NAD(P)-dependent dehydrogenase (short-subunit alcohol dehydrogenase family)